MDGWTIGLIVIVVLGLAAILAGALIDRSRNRRSAEQMRSVPDRVIPQFDPERRPPTYLSELQARRPPRDAPDLALSNSQRDRLEERLRSARAVRVSARLASKTFVTDPPSQRAVLNDALVLLCADEVSSIRELLPVMERSALTGRPLVIAAPRLQPEVLSTIEVNLIQRKLVTVAVLTDERGTTMISELTAATASSTSDRRAGYFPTESLGFASCWVSSTHETTILTAADTEPVG